MIQWILKYTFNHVTDTTIKLQNNYIIPRSFHMSPPILYGLVHTNDQTAFYHYVLSCFSRVQLSVILWTVTCQAPLSMRFFFRQENWSGLPCSPSEDLIFWTQELNPHLLHLLHCKWILYCWATREAHLM